jgi:hypothetical protein
MLASYRNGAGQTDESRRRFPNLGGLNDTGTPE